MVQAIQTLCLKFPHKHRTLVNFLQIFFERRVDSHLRRQLSILVFCIIKNIPDAKDPGLTHLSEFIEDCEFTYLSSQILHLLGVKGRKPQILANTSGTFITEWFWKMLLFEHQQFLHYQNLEPSVLYLGLEF